MADSKILSTGGRINIITWKAELDPIYARKYPLDGSILFLDIHRDYIDILESLKIELICDFFIKGITYQSLEAKIFETINDMVSDASAISKTILDKIKVALEDGDFPSNKNITGLADTKPSGDLYAFYDPEKRRQLNEHCQDLINILRNVHWGNVSPEDQAIEMSDGRYETKGGKQRIFAADDIKKLIKEGLTILRA